MTIAARGEELAVTPSASLRGFYDDNIDLSGGTSAAAGYGASLGAVAVASSENTNLKLDGQFGVVRYSSRPDRDSENGRVAAAFGWRGERLSAAADANFLLDTTRQSDLVETGLVLEPVQRAAFSGGLSLSYTLSERISVAASATASRVRYEQGSDLSDYQDGTATLSLSSALSERLSVGLAALGSVFETEDGATRTRIRSLSAFASYAWSERLNLAVSIGRDWTENRLRAQGLACGLGDPFFCLLLGVPFDVVTIEGLTQTSGRTYGFSAGYEFDTGQLSVRAGQSLKPSGLGSVVRSESVDVNWSQRLREPVSWGLSGSAVQSRSPDGTGAQTQLLRLGTTLSWQFDSDVAADVSLTHTRSSDSLDDRTAVSNALSAGLRYMWPRWTGSY